MYIIFNKVHLQKPTKLKTVEFMQNLLKARKYYLDFLGNIIFGSHAYLSS